jgi:diguanylate cyclase (GGDEF)-like protein
VVPAESGEAALQLYATTQPRIIISDLIMPGLDGIELCRRVRATAGAGGNVPYAVFIMVTLRHEKETMIRALDSGVDDFLCKPIDGDELLARIRAASRVVRLHDELDRRNRSASQVNAQLTQLNSHLERMAITDDLTGLPNRRSGMAKLEEQMALAARYGGPLSVAILDLDFFKRINDTYGHKAGDEVLRNVAATLTATIRATDTVARIGGEEFLIVFPAQTAQEAEVSAERCRLAIKAHAFTFDQQEVHVSASFGIVGRQASMLDPMDLLRLADEALYEAKKAGRDRIAVSAATAVSASAGEALAAAEN